MVFHELNSENFSFCEGKTCAWGRSASRGQVGANPVLAPRLAFEVPWCHFFSSLLRIQTLLRTPHEGSRLFDFFCPAAHSQSLFIFLAQAGFSLPAWNTNTLFSFSIGAVSFFFSSRIYSKKALRNECGTRPRQTRYCLLPYLDMLIFGTQGVQNFEGGP